MKLMYGKFMIVQFRLALICSFLFHHIATGQPADFESIKKTLASYSSYALQEKVFAHTDRSFYIAGETMWFKLYQVEGSTNKPIDISKVGYVEILNRDNKPVLQTKINMNEGAGNGFLDIPTSLVSGNYRFRAYTTWMQNFDPAFYFQKTITIVNSFITPDWKALEEVAPPSLLVFPEGGNLVYGLQSTIGFTMTGSAGNEKDDYGYVLSSDGDTITRFQPYRFGRGQFQFKPERGKIYRAVMKAAGGEAVTTQLGPIYNEGYVMHVPFIHKDQIEVVVQTNDTTRGNEVYLLVHTRQVIRFSDSAKVNNGIAKFVVDKAILNDGVSHFTLFNRNRQPVCERLYFKRPSKEVAIGMKPDKPAYRSREKVTLALQLNEASNLPFQGNLSLAVFHLDSLQPASVDNITTYLGLTSDLVGYVESPEYYFKEAEDELAINNLMLTNGWRRFKWEQVLHQPAPFFQFMPEYEGHIIQARLTGKLPDRRIQNANTYLSVPGRDFRFAHSSPDVNGIVRFAVKNFHSESGILILSKSDSSNDHIEVFSPYSGQYATTPFPPFLLPVNRKKELLFAAQAMQVQNSFSLPRVASQNPTDTTHFYGKPHKTYFLDHFTRFPTMEEIIKEYVTEIRLKKHRKRFSYRVLNAPFKSFFELEPLILIDGVPFDTDQVMGLDPLLVQKIDITARRYHYGPVTNSGIVSYITYKGDMGGLPLNPGSILLDYEGLQQSRAFYSPSYHTETLKHSRLPDFRKLLCWLPDITTNSKGAASVSFYTGDVKGQFLLVLQGLTGGGSTVSGSIIISVAE